MFAVPFGNAVVVNLLLAAGAKTELRNMRGLTALQIAEKEGLDECARYLRMAEDKPE